ncbi:MAG TPA: hypothetical protein VFR24_11690 [Candidatus Angelobacter sp.]|nr:hypothetical protein [Candidatus Angelobacter sp.]
MKLPATISDLNAEISTGVSLSVSPREKDGADQWFEITKKSSVAQDKFDWGSGATLFLYSQANQTPLEIKDWYIFPNNKDFDSRHRAKWRALWFWISLAALLIACMGVIAERLSKEPSKPEFSAQFCVKLLIESIDGKDSKESESMRWLLKKVLIEKTPVNAALSALPLKNLKKWERRGLWFRTADQFRKKLEELIIDLDQYLSYVKKP